MSYSTELGKILSDVTTSTQGAISSIEDGIRAYMIDYFRRGCSLRTMFCAFVDLSRFASDVSQFETNNEPMALASVTRNVIEAHLTRLTLGTEIKCKRKPSPYTVERRRRVIKAFIRWLHSEEYIKTDPTKKLSSVQLRERLPSVWSIEDVDRFLKTFDTADVIGHRNYVIALLALSSGLRAGELAHLRPIDVDLKAKSLSVSHKGKTGARTAVMPTSTVRELVRWLRRCNSEFHLDAVSPLFPSIGSNGRTYGTAGNEPMRSGTISAIIARHAKQAGIQGVKLGSHALRHTAATFLARNGASAFEIQRFLGHASIEMSQRYIAMSNATVQRRVEKHGVLAELSRHSGAVGSDPSKQLLISILHSR